MAKLQVKTKGVGESVLELHPGPNRVGRSPESDFQLDHHTVSARHCEFILSNDSVLLRDCNSTNGTFVNGQPVKEAVLRPGQMVRLGEVELLVEATEVTVAIPKFDRPIPAPPVVRQDGSMLCPRHPEAQATHRCTHCREIM
jgi:pSer/pThr/pTyr-binding forkhead associated (FHA) protein